MVDGLGSANKIVSPFTAAASSARRLPAPLSAVLVTVKMLGSRRSSNISTRGRHGHRLNSGKERRRLPLVLALLKHCCRDMTGLLYGEMWLATGHPFDDAVLIRTARAAAHGTRLIR